MKTRQSKIIFVPKLEEYYEDSNNFTKNLIRWCCTKNTRCTYDTYNYLLPYIETDNKKGFTKNYNGATHTLNDSELKEITDEDISYLDSIIKKIDGTLLVSIVWEFMKNHKVFNN
jgi:hypothetical protein